MLNVEKVIKGLRCITGDLIFCVDCAYSDGNGNCTFGCKASCANDTITMLKEQGMNTDKTTLVIITELFDDEDKPREVLACKKCGQAYKTRHDVINFCSNCGRKIIGEKPLLNEEGM